MALQKETLPKLKVICKVLKNTSLLQLCGNSDEAWKQIEGRFTSQMAKKTGSDSQILGAPETIIQRKGRLEPESPGPESRSPVKASTL